MIVFKCIGGLGNQMFIYAAARAMSLKKREKVILVYEPGQLHYPFRLSGLNVREALLAPDHITYRELKSRYLLERTACILSSRNMKRSEKYTDGRWDQRLSKRNKILSIFGAYFVGYSFFAPARWRVCRNLFCEGYFQSPRYFDEYKEIICRELSVKNERELVDRRLLDDIDQKNSVCVHIRRGDYTTIDKYQVCTADYYQNAIGMMEHLQRDAEYFVFSDDAIWAKKSILWPDKTVFVDDSGVVSEGDRTWKNPFSDLCLMYHCKHFIISNSSFSWWAQYLGKNEDKIVLAPDRWEKYRNNSDIYQNYWTLIDTQGEEL